MMRVSIALSCGLALFAGTVAAADDAPKSIMFEQDKDYSHLTTLPDTNADNKQHRCTELAREMETLKGKPQRRFTLSQQYDAECRR